MSIIENIIPKPHFYLSTRTCDSYEVIFFFNNNNSYIFRLKNIAVFSNKKQQSI